MSNLICGNVNSTINLNEETATIKVDGNLNGDVLLTSTLVIENSESTKTGDSGIEGMIANTLISCTFETGIDNATINYVEVE